MIKTGQPKVSWTVALGLENHDLSQVDLDRFFSPFNEITEKVVFYIYSGYVCQML